MATKKANTKTATTAVRQGRKIAIDMMEKLIDEGCCVMSSIEPRWRPRGKPQYNICLTFIQEVCRRPELAEGFAAVLTDYLKLNEGPIVEKSFYRDIEKRLRRTEKKVEAAHG